MSELQAAVRDLSSKGAPNSTVLPGSRLRAPSQSFRRNAEAAKRTFALGKIDEALKDGSDDVLVRMRVFVHALMGARPGRAMHWAGLGRTMHGVD
jgi:hypothetical protein